MISPWEWRRSNFLKAQRDGRDDPSPDPFPVSRLHRPQRLLESEILDRPRDGFDLHPGRSHRGETLQQAPQIAGNPFPGDKEVRGIEGNLHAGREPRQHTNPFFPHNP